MSRTISLTTILSLLCGLMLTAVYAEKTPKTPKTPEQIAKYERLHPTSTPVATPRPPTGQDSRPDQYRPPVAYQNPQPGRDSRPDQYRPPVTTPAPQSTGDWRRGDQTVVQPYRRDDNNNNNNNRPGSRYVYPGNPRESDRAYELPRRDGRDDRDGRDGHGRPGGGGNGGDWGRPYSIPPPVYIPDPYPVYVPVPGPGYYPGPPPRCGGRPAYYPEYRGRYTARDCGNVNDMPLLGSEIIAGDGTFLGVIDRDYDSPESIGNRRGEFGSPYSQMSIWNPEGPYGSPVAPYSPWNRDSYRPPILYWHGVFRGYLTCNSDFEPAISPVSLPKHLWISPWR